MNQNLIKLLIALFFWTWSSAEASCQSQKNNFTIIDPADGKELTLTQWSFGQDKKTSHVVFILPAIGGENFLDKRLARKLCKRGMMAMIVNTIRSYEPNYVLANLHVHQDSYTRASLAIEKLIIDLSASNAAKRFSIVGTSLGGMLAAYVAGDLASMIDRSVVIVGAGNAAAVLANSDQPRVVEQRRQRMAYFALSEQAAYEALLRQHIVKDPLDVAPLVHPNSMLLVTGDSDTTVPTRYQRELVNAVASPNHLALRGSHVGAILKTHLLHIGKVVKFLAR